MQQNYFTVLAWFSAYLIKDKKHKNTHFCCLFSECFDLSSLNLEFTVLFKIVKSEVNYVQTTFWIPPYGLQFLPVPCSRDPV